ncbi:MAG: PEP-CTERM sorting domain-containing protein [Prosthecobacter sp.]
MKTCRVLLLAAFACSLLGSGKSIHAADFGATWNGTTGNWSDATKWSTNPVFPNNGVNTFDALQSAGTLTVNQDITIQKFTMNGGTNTGAGFALTTNELLTLAGGNVNGTGIINALGGASIGAIEMSGRTINLGDGVGPVVNTTWNSGNPLVHSGMVINNKSDSNFIIGFDGGNFWNINRGGSMVFNNEGTFTKNGGTGTANFGGNNNFATFAFNNSGVVQVNSGTLAIQATSGTHTGTFEVASGAVLNYTGTATLGTGATFNGAGTAIFAGTMNATGAATVNSSLNLTGTLTGSGPVTTNGTLTFTGGLDNAANLTALGDVAFNGAGRTIANGSVLNLGDGAGPDAGSTTNWSSGNILLRTGSTLNNRNDSVINTTANNSLFSNFNGTAVTFNNEGTFNQNGTGTTTLGGSANAFVFNNTGAVNVNSGTLDVQSTSGTHTGTFEVASGAVLNYTGTATLGSGTSFNGAGTTIFAGTMNASAAVTVNSTLNLTGVVNGSGPVTTNGTLTFTGGLDNAANLTALGDVVFNGAGRSIANGSVLNLGDGAGPDAGSTTTWSSGNILLRSGSTLNNRSDSVINATANNSLFSNFNGTSVTFNNEGTFNQNGTGTTTFGGNTNAFVFNNTGTVNVNSGTLALGDSQTFVTQHVGSTLTGGTWNVSNGASITRTFGSNITTIGSAASVTLDGAGSSFDKVTTALNTNQGNFPLKNDRDLTTIGAYLNSGTTRVEDNGTAFTIGTGGSAAYTQSMGETVLVGGALIDASVFNLNGGELKGNGTIASSVVTGGTQTIAPGLSPGMLTIEGDLTLSAGSTLAMEIGGLGQGTDYDFLDVNGVLTLAGILDLDMLNGFENLVQSSDVFTLATANSPILGSFSNVASGSRIWTDTHISFDVWYGAGSIFDPNSLVITGAPEPTRGVLLLLGLGSLVMRRRRSRTVSPALSDRKTV